jgi:glutaredoxin 3
MAEVVVYTKDYCPYCTRAKDILKKKGAEVKEIDVTNDENLLAEMIEKSGGRKSVPEIFINGQHIGGHDDMVELDRKGELDKLLSA